MDALADALARVLGTAVTHLRSVSGGDINDTFVARLGDGRDVFVKTNGSRRPAHVPVRSAWARVARRDRRGARPDRAGGRRRCGGRTPFSRARAHGRRAPCARLRRQAGPRPGAACIVPGGTHSGSSNRTSSPPWNRTTGGATRGRSSMPPAGWNRWFVPRWTAAAVPPAWTRQFARSSRGFLLSPGRPSRRHACTATSGAATSSRTNGAIPSSSIPPSTVDTVKWTSRWCDCSAVPAVHSLQPTTRCGRSRPGRSTGRAPSALSAARPRQPVRWSLRVGCRRGAARLPVSATIPSVDCRFTPATNAGTRAPVARRDGRFRSSAASTPSSDGRAASPMWAAEAPLLVDGRACPSSSLRCSAAARMAPASCMTRRRAGARRMPGSVRLRSRSRAGSSRESSFTTRAAPASRSRTSVRPRPASCSTTSRLTLVHRPDAAGAEGLDVRPSLPPALDAGRLVDWDTLTAWEHRWSRCVTARHTEPALNVLDGARATYGVERRRGPMRDWLLLFDPDAYDHRSGPGVATRAWESVVLSAIPEPLRPPAGRGTPMAPSAHRPPRWPGCSSTVPVPCGACLRLLAAPRRPGTGDPAALSGSGALSRRTGRHAEVEALASSSMPRC